MLEQAARQAPHATVVQGDALALPFPDRSFDRVFTAHFYGHLEDAERQRFLAEAARVAGELVVVDSSRAGVDADEEMQKRVLNDGSDWRSTSAGSPVRARRRTRRRRGAARRPLVRRRPRFRLTPGTLNE